MFASSSIFPISSICTIRYLAFCLAHLDWSRHTLLRKASALTFRGNPNLWSDTLFGSARTIYINGVYGILAGKSPNIQSYASYIYGSGQPLWYDFRLVATEIRLLLHTHTSYKSSNSAWMLTAAKMGRSCGPMGELRRTSCCVKIPVASGIPAAMEGAKSWQAKQKYCSHRRGLSDRDEPGQRWFFKCLRCDILITWLVSSRIALR
jgi:hypothetical protein